MFCGSADEMEDAFVMEATKCGCWRIMGGSTPGGGITAACVEADVGLDIDLMLKFGVVAPRTLA